MAHEASVGWQGKRAKDKTPGGPRMYRVERGKGDRERSQRSPEGRTMQTLVKNNTSKTTNQHCLMLLWPKDCIWQLHTSPFQLGKSSFRQVSGGVVFQ